MTEKCWLGCKESNQTIKNHLLENIHTCTIGTIYSLLCLDGFKPLERCLRIGLEHLFFLGGGGGGGGGVISFLLYNHLFLNNRYYLGLTISVRLQILVFVTQGGAGGRFTPDPVRPLDVSPQRRFAPGRFAPGRFAPLVVSPLVDSPQEEKSTYFVEIYVNS